MLDTEPSADVKQSSHAVQGKLQTGCRVHSARCSKQRHETVASSILTRAGDSFLKSVLSNAGWLHG